MDRAEVIALLAVEPATRAATEAAWEQLWVEEEALESPVLARFARRRRQLEDEIGEGVAGAGEAFEELDAKEQATLEKVRAHLQARKRDLQQQDARNHFLSQVMLYEGEPLHVERLDAHQLGFLTELNSFSDRQRLPRHAVLLDRGSSALLGISYFRDPTKKWHRGESQAVRAAAWAWTAKGQEPSLARISEPEGQALYDQALTEVIPF